MATNAPPFIVRCPIAILFCLLLAVYPTHGQGCSDYSGWSDSEGDTCQVYAGNRYCTAAGQYGRGWSWGWGPISSYAVRGIDAFDACCGCGGGRQDANKPPNIPSPNPSPRPSPSPRPVGTGGGSGQSLVPANPIKLDNRIMILPVDPTVYVNKHNALRCKHGSPGLVWSDAVTAKALQWARTCTFEHTGGSYGENLYASTNLPDAATVVQRWYDEISMYSTSRPGFSRATGHFTQVVWKDTLRVGCAMCQTPYAQFGYNVMCMYDPPGNVNTRQYFQANVLQVRPDANCDGNSDSDSLPPMDDNTEVMFSNAEALAPAAAAAKTTADTLLTTGISAAARRLSSIKDSFQSGAGPFESSSFQWRTNIFQGTDPVTAAVIAMSVVLILAAAAIGWHVLRRDRATDTVVLSQLEMSLVAVPQDDSVI